MSVRPTGLAETERGFQAWIEEYAHLLKWRTYHTYDARRSNPGFPDLVMVRGDRVVFAEVKTETGRVTVEQGEWLHDLRRATTVEAHLWRPRDRSAIPRVLA